MDDFLQKLDMLVAEEISKTENGADYPVKVATALVKRASHVIDDFGKYASTETLLEGLGVAETTLRKGNEIFRD